MRLCPSLLSADFSCLSKQIDPLKEIGVKHLHVDMMDGHFVRNLAIGIPALQSLRSHYPDIILDTHLELTNPENLIDPLVEAGADCIAVQTELNPDFEYIRERTGGHDIQIGLSVNPDTALEGREDHIDQVDYVVLLSVMPGFGGQAFREDVLPKLRRLRRNFDGPIQIDGGLNPENVRRAIDAGADWIVAGSSVFGSENPADAARTMMDQFPER